MIGWMIGISATIVSMFMSVYTATSGLPNWGMLWLGLMIVSFVADGYRLLLRQENEIVLDKRGGTVYKYHCNVWSNTSMDWLVAHGNGDVAWEM